MSCVVQIPVTDFSSEFKEWTNLHKDNHMHGYGYP